MSTINAYSAWLNRQGSVSVLCGQESDSLSAISMGKSARLLRTAIHTFSVEVFASSFGIDVSNLEGTDAQNPFRFQDNGLKPINLESVFGRAVKIQIVETSDFNTAVSYKIINEKDANGNFIVRDSAYKLDRETKNRVVDSNGSFVYRKCFLRPDTEAYKDVLVSVEKRPTADINLVTENVPVEEDANADNVPF
jgi:hypothetical protein